MLVSPRFFMPRLLISPSMALQTLPAPLCARISTPTVTCTGTTIVASIPRVPPSTTASPATSRTSVRPEYRGAIRVFPRTNRLTARATARKVNILFLPDDARLQPYSTCRFWRHADHSSVSGGGHAPRPFLAQYDHSTPARSSSSDPESAVADQRRFPARAPVGVGPSSARRSHSALVAHRHRAPRNHCRQIDLRADSRDTRRRRKVAQASCL